MIITNKLFNVNQYCSEKRTTEHTDSTERNRTIFPDSVYSVVVHSLPLLAAKCREKRTTEHTDCTERNRTIFPRFRVFRAFSCWLFFSSVSAEGKRTAENAENAEKEDGMWFIFSPFPCAPRLRLRFNSLSINRVCFTSRRYAKGLS